MLALFATVLVAVPAPGSAARPASSSDPVIQVSLNSGGNFAPGGRVSVRVQTRDDGYLVVLRVDGDGRVRVLFPLDPDGDPFVRGGKEYELRGRGDHETFLADDQSGNGMIYAALAHDPLAFNDFVANGHWDYDALRLPDSTSDPETDMTALVAGMTNRSRFDYDAVGYRVQEIGTIAALGGGGYYSGYYDPYYDPRWRCLGCGWAYPGSDIVLGLNFGYSPYWDPWLYSPWGYNYGYGYGSRYGGGYWFPGTYPVVIPRPGRSAPPGTRSRPRADFPEPRGGMGNGGSGSVAQPPASSGGRSRPEAGGTTPPPAVRNAPPPSGSGSGSVGTRSRPRPMDISVTRGPSPSVRPVFREPPSGGQVSPPSGRTRPQDPSPSSRPQYREPPHADRSPPPSSRPSPPSSRSSPPPSQRSAPQPSQHSAPPPSTGRARPRGGG